MKKYLTLSIIATTFLLIILSHTFDSLVLRFFQGMISCILFASISYLMKQFRATRKQETLKMLLRLKSFIYGISYIGITSVVVLIILHHITHIPNGIYNSLILLLLILSIPTRIIYYLAIKEDK